MSAPSSFGLWIRRRRRLLDLTQEQLAERVGCSHSAIRKIEGDERRPSRQVAELLADALRIDPGERALFLRIARLELRVDELAAIADPALAPVALPAGLPIPAPPVVPAAPAPVAAPPQPAFRLPAPPTPLVGREVELVQIASTLLDDECRLLTLVGPGGIGKSRLALAAVPRLAAAFPDGVAFAPLAGVQPASAGSIANSLALAVANALDVGQYGHADPVRQLQVFLRGKRLLLILDSMEHLLDGGDALVSELLRQAPEIKILATSREQLNLQGEWLIQVRGLSLPEREAAATWEHSSAMRLFVQSARRANVTFEPDAADSIAIARICRLVEGMPLAIELAASWVRVLSCSEIAAETERDWGFLSGAARDMPARHRSLRAVFDQSWALLSERERAILRALSVFRRGFRREAAARVAEASLPDLAALAAKSLIAPVPGTGDRFEVHELVRQYAAERLAAAGGATESARRHAETLRNWAEAAEPELHRAAQGAALDRLEADHENLRAALAWLRDHDPQSGLRLANALWWFWFVRGHWAEGRAWFAAMLAAEPAAGPTRAAALARAANLAWMGGDTAGALPLVEEAQRTAQQIADAGGDESALVLADYVQGQVATHRDPALSNESFANSRARARRLDDRWGEARALYRLGVNSFVDDDLPTARRLYHEALALFRALGDQWGIYAALSDAGGVARRAGALEEAQRIGEESLAICRALGFRQGIALELLSLGIGYWQQGDFAAARSALGESRRAFAEIDNKRGVADAHLHLSHTARWEGDLHEAAVQAEFALTYSREAGFAPAIAAALHAQAALALLEGEHARTRTLLRESIAAEGEGSGLRFGRAAALETAAALAEAEGRAETAALLLGAAGALRMQTTAALVPVEVAGLRRLEAALRERLGVAAFDAALARGAALSADAALEMAVA